ncbi:MAG: Hsp20/alpha crystallin family protein [Chloroflexota bacterium]|nr:Hsp20/alpha crystallin family protein [Chloroflexota bacterium]
MFVVRRGNGRSIDRLQYEMEDVFQAMLGSGMPVRVRVLRGDVPAWRPPVEVYETDDELVVLVELAGVVEDDIEVAVDDSVMTVRGERRPTDCADRRTIHTMGIVYGRFAVDVFLPFAVDSDRAEASYEAGILRVNLPRSSVTRIAVEGSSASRTTGTA